jgi:DNA-binding MarR family transcriptional regulator
MSPDPQALALQAQLSAFVRAFGLHQPEQTPCGQPIPVSEAHAITELYREGPMAQHELVARLNLQKSTVSRLVTQLENRGWLSRRRETPDGRVAVLELTDAGRRAALQVVAARAAKFDRLLAALPADRRGDVIEALSLLVEALHDDH